MKTRYFMYIIISIICIICITIAIFSQVKKEDSNISEIKNNIVIDRPEVTKDKTQEELNKEFNNIFDNKIHLENYNTETIEKSDVTKEIIYTVYANEEKTEKYDVNINLPVVNIVGDIANNFNKITQEVFADKATKVLSEAEKYTIYTVSYTSYINGDILSVIIKSSLKEGASAQRVIIQTYNYNLKTGKEATIEDVINQRGVTTDEVSKKINNKIIDAIKESNDIQISGYEVFVRDIDSEMYLLENTKTYYLGIDGSLNILYAYGNNEFTSEIDIIEI